MSDRANLIGPFWRSWKALSLLSWVFEVLVAAVFVLSVAANFTPSARLPIALAPSVVHVFGDVGDGLRYLVGGAELVGSALLFLPKTWWAGWTVLVCATVATLLARVFISHKDPSVSLQLLSVLMLMAWIPGPRVRTFVRAVRALGEE
jgi:hypothetical protein